MLITSKIDGTKWLWVNVPKTASTAVMRTFFPYKDILEQEHNCYSTLVSLYGNLNAFTTVRNPIERFISALNHTAQICVCGQCKFFDKIDTLDVIYFLRDMLILKSERNDFFEAVYKNVNSNYHYKIINIINNRFKKQIHNHNINCLRISAFVSQTFMLNGPQENLRVFKYEKLQELSGFIKNTLGYEMDNTLYRKYPNKLGVDFSDPTVVNLLHELYREDFENFNY